MLLLLSTSSSAPLLPPRVPHIVPRIYSCEIANCSQLVGVHQLIFVWGGGSPHKDHALTRGFTPCFFIYSYGYANEPGSPMHRSEPSHHPLSLIARERDTRKTNGYITHVIWAAAILFGRPAQLLTWCGNHCMLSVNI